MATAVACVIVLFAEFGSHLTRLTDLNTEELPVFVEDAVSCRWRKLELHPSASGFGMGISGLGQITCGELQPVAMIGDKFFCTIKSEREHPRTEVPVNSCNPTTHYESRCGLCSRYLNSDGPAATAGAPIGYYVAQVNGRRCSGKADIVEAIIQAPADEPVRFVFDREKPLWQDLHFCSRCNICRNKSKYKNLILNST